MINQWTWPFSGGNYGNSLESVSYQWIPHNPSLHLSDGPQEGISAFPSYGHSVAEPSEGHHCHYHHQEQCQMVVGGRWEVAGMGGFPARIGLDLGGRTYFSAEDGQIAVVGGGGASANSAPRCQAEGCLADLRMAKHYHRRHKVCELHSKAATVVVAGGATQRFCQQCSRFHVLSEFDEGKRSCRKRLADHNRRRRKNQLPCAFSSSSSQLDAPFNNASTRVKVPINNTDGATQGRESIDGRKCYSMADINTFKF